MDKHHVFQPFVQAVSLCILALWWIFFIAWQPGFVMAVERVAYRFEPPSLSSEVVVNATVRAIEYATKGTPNQADIFFTQAEVSHLQDVANIYKRIRMSTGILATASCVALLLFLQRGAFHAGAFHLARNILVCLVLLLALALFVFPFFFLLFHEVAFPQGNWAFPENSILIQLFPETFWKLSLGWLFIGTGIFALFYHIVGGVHRRHAQ